MFPERKSTTNHSLFAYENLLLSQAIIGIGMMVALVVGSPAQGQNRTWNPTVSNSWNSALNWFPFNIPDTTAEMATVVDGITNINPLLFADVQIGGLTIEGGGKVNTNTFDLFVNPGSSGMTGLTFIDQTGQLIVNGSIFDTEHLRVAGTMDVNLGFAQVDITTQIDTTGVINVRDHLMTPALTGSGQIILDAQELGPGLLTVGEGNTTVAATFLGVISGDGTLRKRGTGTVTPGAANTYTGETSIEQGQLRLTGNGRLSDHTTVDVAAGASFRVNVPDAIWTLSGNGIVDLGGATSLLVVGNFGNAGGGGTFHGTIIGPGRFEKRGTGTTFTLTGFNTYHGATTISQGTLRISGAGRLSDLSTVTVASGATMLMSHSSADAIWGLIGDGSVVLDGSTLVVGNFSSEGGVGDFGGSISGSGSFEKRGPGIQTLAGSSTYTGFTKVTEGTLRVANAIGSATGSGDVSVESEGILEINDGSISTNHLTNNGGSILMTAGLLDVDMLDIQAGSFEMVDGRLQVATVMGDLEIAGGTLAVANSPGILSFEEGLILQPDANLEINIAGTELIVDFDLLAVNGDVSLSGSLDVNLIAPFVLDLGQEFTIVSAAENLTGQFAGLTDGDVVGIFDQVPLFIRYNDDSVVLYTADELLLGDVNLDGVINLLDVNPFIERLSTGEFQAEADVNEDGVVNLLDVNPFIELLSGG